MISDDEFIEMCSKLEKAVAEVCRECEMPLIHKADINLADPAQCQCSCGKVEGICKALRDMKNTVN